jgi:formiminoglutamate deiminase
MPVRRWHAELAVVGDDVHGDVLIEADGERLTAVSAGADRPRGAERLPGLTLPGLANAHSHAFHRMLRGRTDDVAQGTFWTWRQKMYAVAERLDPDGYFELARAVFAEMALAGVTAVGEFHYLHHRAGGGRYDDPNAMGLALAAAADAAGVRLTLLDTCYLQGGVDGRPLDGVQLRFGDQDADRWADRVGALRPGRRLVIGAAIHGVRAVPLPAMDVVGRWAADRDVPLHLHLSEQRAENAACLAVHGCTPTALLASLGVLRAGTTAVHATHLTDGDISLLGGTRTGVCLCPTTERNLADGVGPAARLACAGSTLSLGSDSNAVIDLFEEARAVELDERLVTEERGHHRPADLLRAATAGGMAALGWDAGVLGAGRLADFVTVGLGSPRMAGLRPPWAIGHLVFGATAADVTDVVVGGERVVAGGRHLSLGDVGRRLRSAIAQIDAAG